MYKPATLWFVATRKIATTETKPAQAGFFVWESPPMNFDLTHDFDRMLTILAAAIDRRARYAAAVALTRTAQAVRDELRAGMQQAFDRPTSFTLKGIALTPATKQNLVATVYAKPAQARYLRPQVEGGGRTLKAFENKWKRPAFTMPGAGVRLDQHGNVTKAQILKIAAELNSYGTAKRYFQGVPKGHDLPEGIYARVDNNNKIVPLLVFASAPEYEKRFRFTEIAKRTVTRAFEIELLRAWKDAA